MALSLPWRAPGGFFLRNSFNVVLNVVQRTAPTSIPGILAMIEVFLDEDSEEDPRFLLKSIAAVLKPLRRALSMQWLGRKPQVSGRGE